MIFNSFLTNNSAPATGLTPTILVYQVGELSNSLVVNNDPMEEVGSGFYKYVFSLYNPNNNYVYLIDAGVSVNPAERYRYGGSEEVKLEESQNADIAASVLAETITGYNDPSTVGGVLNFIKSDTASIVISQTTIASLINTLLKYQRNRTRIDTTAKTLTIFDDDCTTVLQVFDLKDSDGAPSVVEVCERSPAGCP